MGKALTPSAGMRIWVLPACASVAVVGMHLLPGSDLAADDWWAVWHMDKLLHMLAFCGCGLTWAIALAKQRRLQGPWQFPAVLVAGTLIFGTVLEAMQGAWMSGRFFDLADVVADVLGAGMSLGMFQVIFGCQPGRIASD
jgi:hypothetical protein